jgi:hypothetical protein
MRSAASVVRLGAAILCFALSACAGTPYAETIPPKVALHTFPTAAVVVTPGDGVGVTNMVKSMGIFARGLAGRMKEDGTIQQVAIGTGLTADLYIVAEMRQFDRDSDMANAFKASIAKVEVEVKLVDAEKQLIGQFTAYGNARDYENSFARFTDEPVDNDSDKALIMAARHAADYLAKKR